MRSVMQFAREFALGATFVLGALIILFYFGVV